MNMQIDGKDSCGYTCSQIQTKTCGKIQVDTKINRLALGSGIDGERGRQLLFGGCINLFMSRHYFHSKIKTRKKIFEKNSRRLAAGFLARTEWTEEGPRWARWSDEATGLVIAHPFLSISVEIPRNHFKIRPVLQRWERRWFFCWHRQHFPERVCDFSSPFAFLIEKISISLFR